MEISGIPYMCHQVFCTSDKPVFFRATEKPMLEVLHQYHQVIGQILLLCCAAKKKVCLVIVIVVIPQKWMPFRNPSGTCTLFSKKTQGFLQKVSTKCLKLSMISHLPGFAGAACQSCPELETPDSDGQRRWMTTTSSTDCYSN